jgi:predicted nucleic acid-binding protein
MIKLSELLTKVDDDLDTEIIISGIGSVQGEADVLISVLNSETMSLVVSDIGVYEGHLRLWVEEE